MKKPLFLIFLVLCFEQTQAQYIVRQHIRRYHLALTATSPLSGTFKYGGGLENRWRNFAYLFSYNRNYSGLYPGTDMDLEFRIYLRKRWINSRYGVTFQNFIFARGIFGDAAYEGPNVHFLGFNDNTELPDNIYYGGAAGIGRRYTKGVLFFTLRGGIRVVELPDLPADYKNSYRIFYFTGPGSYLEAHLQVGIQI